MTTTSNPVQKSCSNFSFDQGKENGINCLSLSIALTECLLGLGICARAMSIMPMSPYDRDNHVVCEAYARDLGKWIMVDPTYGGYITDEQGNILNLMEMRECLSNRQTLCYSENYNYNGDKVDPRMADHLLCEGSVLPSVRQNSGIPHQQDGKQSKIDLCSHWI